MASIYTEPVEIIFKVDGCTLEIRDSMLSLNNCEILIGLDHIENFIQAIRDIHTIIKMKTEKV